MSSFYDSVMQGSGSTGSTSPTNSTGFKQIKEKVPSGYKAGALQQFTPEQMKLFEQMFGFAGEGSFLHGLASGDESSFAEMEAPAMRQFNQMQGNIASRFSGQGLGGTKGSGFQNAMTSASSNFAQDLASRRNDLRRQAIQDLMGVSNTLLSQKPYERFLVEKDEQQPFWKKALGMISPVGGDIAEGGTQNTENFMNVLKMFGGGA